MKEMDDTNIAVLANDMGYIKKSMDNLEKKMEDLSVMFVNRNEFSEFKKDYYSMTKKVDQLEQKIWFASGAITILFLVLKFAFKTF